MAKAAKGKWSNGKNAEFTVRGKSGHGGQAAPAVSGAHKKGDSRSKMTMRNITPSKTY